MFALVVEDFGVDFVGKEHVKHLTDTLRMHFDITEDQSCEKQLSIDLQWDCIKRAVRLSMKNCIKQFLIRFNRLIPSKPCHSPHANKAPTHGDKIQCASTPDELSSLDIEQTKRMQAIVGSLLCYARAFDKKIIGSTRHNCHANSFTYKIHFR